MRSGLVSCVVDDDISEEVNSKLKLGRRDWSADMVAELRQDHPSWSMMPRPAAKQLRLAERRCVLDSAD
jgi:hypothetical protein